jgi:hexosaminidase
MLKARAFHPNFKPSDEISQRFIKVKKSIQPKSIKFEKSPTPNYPGEAQDLIDLKKGTLNFRSATWMAFKSDATVYIVFNQPTTFQKMIVSSLSDAGSWIMPPKGIIVETSNNGKAYSTVATNQFPLLKDYEPAHLTFPTIEFQQPLETSFLKITIQFAGKLPEWHSGKGYASWLFLDEIIFE